VEEINDGEHIFDGYMDQICSIPTGPMEDHECLNSLEQALQDYDRFIFAGIAIDYNHHALKVNDFLPGFDDILE
jgi:hypothetical protein